ncbi:hypothetical protein VWO06_09395, partial [Campylobacter coli]
MRKARWRSEEHTSELFRSLFANNFSQKKIIKLEQQESFEIIDLQQNVEKQNLDQQKGIFD